MALLRVRKESNTYNPNYPWLNKASYDKMVSAVNKMGIPEEEKEAATNQWYRDNVKYLLNDQTLDERAKEINEQAYQAAEAKSPEANAQLRMTEFSQALKKKYNLDATANDLDVFNTFVENLGEDGVNLAWQYLSWENKKLWYDAWLETFWEKLADAWVGFLQSPGKRGYNLVGQRADRGAEKIKDRTEDTKVWDRLSEKSTNLIKRVLKKNWLSDEEIENEINAYVQQRDQSLEDGTAFNGREQTDIRTPLLWEERANSKATKVWETIGDIATWIAVTAPMSVALAPAMAWGTAVDAALLGGVEWGVDTLLTQLGSQGNLDISPTQAILGVWGGALWGVITNKLANLPKTQQQNIRKEASEYIEKSIKPTVKGKQSQAAYNKFIDDTLDVTDYMSKNKKVLQYTDDAGNVVREKLPTNLRETSETLGNLKKYIYDQYNDLAQKAGDAGARVNLNKVYSKLDDLANDTAANLANPWLKNAIEWYKNQLLQYSDDLGTISIADAQEVTQYYNKILDAYFKNPGAMATDTSKNLVVANLNRSMKEAIDESMDDVLNTAINNGSTASETYKGRKQLYGKIKTIEDEVSKRALVEARKNTKGLSTDIIDALAWGNLVEGLLTQNPSGFLKGAVMKGINAYNKYLNSPNTQIRNLFNLVDKVNNPTALQTLGTNLTNDLARNVTSQTLANAWNLGTNVAEVVGNVMGNADLD